MMTRDGDCWRASGALTMETVPALYRQGLQLLAQGDLCVDFSAVERVDSATVSLLLGWVREAEKRQRQFRINGLPVNVQNLANLYGVADLLPAH